MASTFHHLFCVFVLNLPLLISAQPYRNLTLGFSLSNLDKNPYWTSPSGEFSFGFHPQEGLFLLAIWYAKIPIKTIIWTANEGKLVERGATIQLTSDGVLSLRTQNGTEIWKAQAVDSSRVTNAAMLNTGNFVLTTIESTIEWQSFDNPTDTILPSQILEIGSKLSSRLTEKDYTIGRYEFILRSDGNLVLRTMSRPTEGFYEAYWSSNTTQGSELVFNQSASIYLTLNNRSMYYVSSRRPDSARDYYQRATLDFDGVLRQYTYPKTSPLNGRWPESWSISLSLPRNICELDHGYYGAGVCGYNSYCNLDEDQKPECECPPGYSYIDPKNTFGGCIRTFVSQRCKTSERKLTHGFEMQALLGTDFLYGDYEWFKSVNEDWCRETCLGDCFCAAAITREGNCFLKKFPLSQGYMNPGSKGKALIKVGNSSIDHAPSPVLSGNYKKKNTNKKKWIVPGSTILGSSIFLNILLAFFLVSNGAFRKKQSKIQRNSSRVGEYLRLFTYKELEEATEGFKEELGKGSVSTVYKGVLNSESGSLVAVKKLEKLMEGKEKEFKAELDAIAQTNHKNLVQLVGYCIEGDHRLLVYELMRNGSLASFLFGSLRLEWQQRIQIAFGIARGLAYLHEECSTQIIHCDLKPQNILLDDSYVARISDFGLAKLLKINQTQTTTGIRGTRGYVAPEWFKNMAITGKVDVYSFGIMLLEIICCKKNVEFEEGDEDVEILSDWAYECCVQRTFHLLRANDEEGEFDNESLERLVKVAIWCIQEDPSLRPSMKKVTQMLEGAVEVCIPPDPSSFISSID